jgi:hypothetical protein
MDIPARHTILDESVDEAGSDGEGEPFKGSAL